VPSPRRRFAGRMEAQPSLRSSSRDLHAGVLPDKPFKKAMERHAVVAAMEKALQAGDMPLPPSAPQAGPRRPSRLTLRRAEPQRKIDTPEAGICAADLATESKPVRCLEEASPPLPSRASPSSSSQPCLQRPGSASQAMRFPEYMPQVTFPAPLNLRRCSEPAGHPSLPWVSPSESFGLPLQLQKEVRHDFASQRAEALELQAGQQITMWAMGKGVDVEPLAASARDSFEVVPTVCRVESSSQQTAQPIRHGECFRLRVAGHDGPVQYLAHGSVDGSEGLTWAVVDPDSGEPPSKTRFAAHGGELGRPVHLACPLKVMRVPSPAPSTDSSDEESDPENDAYRATAAPQPRATDARGPLLSRLADVQPAFPATFLLADTQALC